MKAITVIAGLTLVSLGSVANAYTTTAQERNCIDTFIEQQLGSNPNVRVVREYVPPMPLIIRSELQMKITAVERSTGRTIASATCEPRRGLVEVHDAREVDER